MSVHDRPSHAELLAAVRAYLLDEVVPSTTDRRAIFRARIAANVLAIVSRELATKAQDDAAEDDRLRDLLHLGDGTDEERRRELSAAIRNGDYDDPVHSFALMEYARASTRDKLTAANPKFLSESEPPRLH